MKWTYKIDGALQRVVFQTMLDGNDVRLTVDILRDWDADQIDPEQIAQTVCKSLNREFAN